MKTKENRERQVIRNIKDKVREAPTRDLDDLKRREENEPREIAMGMTER